MLIFWRIPHGIPINSEYSQELCRRMNNVSLCGHLPHFLSTKIDPSIRYIDLVNSVIIFPSPMTLLRRSIFLLGSHSVWLFWISFFLLMLVFVPQWLSLHLEILIMFLSQFPLTFHHIHNKIPHFIKLLMTILVLIGLVFMII